LLHVARPDKKETWEEQARLLVNARTLCENDEISFIDYMIAKGDARYLKTTFLVERLFQTPQYQEIMEFTGVQRRLEISCMAV
jgi:hypothetical protein